MPSGRPPISRRPQSRTAAPARPRTGPRLRLALAAFALVLASQASAQDVEREDPAANPAEIAPLAARSLLLDLAWAGPRVFAVGERGHILHSDDAGKTWVQSPVPASATLTAVYFADDRHGWAVGHVEAILATSDGGESWRLAHFEPGNPQPLLDVASADAARGVAIGAYVTVLWALGLDGTLDGVAHPDTDTHGKTLEASRRPARVRKSQKSKNEYDF